MGDQNLDDDTTEIWICQGPPRCSLQGDEAVAEQHKGCPWCEVKTIWPDGSETTKKPVEA